MTDGDVPAATLRLRRPWLAAAASLAALFPTAAHAEPLRAMTFNIRYATAADGANAWPLRQDLALEAIRAFDPDVLGVQEALRRQMDDLAGALPEYASVGVGREADGGGEYSAILYRRSRLDVEAAGTFWLSATPDEPGSRTWGNELPRICTWARFVDRADGRRFTLINTHWDHQSQRAREESGRLMAERIAAWVDRGEPVIALGDFNAGPKNAALAALVRDGALLRDTFADRYATEGDVGTAHGFSGATGGEKIDHILVSAPWRVADAAIVRAHNGDRYPSDHFPVTAVVSLPADARRP